MRALVVAIGVALAWCYTGFVEHAYRIVDCAPLTFRAAAGAALLATAVGPRMLRGLGLRLVRLAQARLTEDMAPEPARVSIGADRDLLWMATSVAGLAAGLGALLIPEALGLAADVLDWGYARFLWSSASLTLFESGVLLAAALVPFALIGFFLRCVHQLACPLGRWGFTATGWLLAGLALGFGTLAAVVAFPPRGLLLLRAGAIVLLLAAIVSVVKASPAVRRVRVPRAAGAIAEPEMGERWPMVLRLAVAVCVCAGATHALVWIYVLEALGMGSYAGRLAGASLLFLAGAGGFWWALREAAGVSWTIGALGERLALAGLASALGVALFNLVARACYAPFVRTPGGWLLWAVCAAVPLGLAGRVVGFGGSAMLRHAAHSADMGARLLRMILLAAAAATTLTALPLLAALGSYPALVAASLALLATGGILMIHEPACTKRTQRVRVAGVFVAVLVMTCAMPIAGAGWLGDARSGGHRLLESWWLTWDVRAGRALGGVSRSDAVWAEDGGSPAVAGLFDWEALPRGARVGVVSLMGGGAPVLPASFGGRLTSWAVERDLQRRLRGETGLELSALRALRAAAERYDLLILSCGQMPEALVRRIFASRALDDALARLAPDGVLAILLPRHECFTVHLERCLDVIGRADDVHLSWTACSFRRQDGIALLAARSASGSDSAARWCVGALSALEPPGSPATWAAALVAQSSSQPAGTGVALVSGR